MASLVLRLEALLTQGAHASSSCEVEGQTLGADGLALEEDNRKGSREVQVLEGRIVLDLARVRLEGTRYERTAVHLELLGRG